MTITMSKIAVTVVAATPTTSMNSKSFTMMTDSKGESTMIPTSIASQSASDAARAIESIMRKESIAPARIIASRPIGRCRQKDTRTTTVSNNVTIEIAITDKRLTTIIT